MTKSTRASFLRAFAAEVASLLAIALDLHTREIFHEAFLALLAEFDRALGMCTGELVVEVKIL
jgi:hypothetical protein